MSNRRGKPGGVDAGTLCLAFTLTIIGASGCGGGRGESSDPQTAAVTALEKLNAQIRRDDDGAVVSVFASKFDTTDAALVHLSKLSGLKQLSLEETKITDDGLVHIAGLTNLQKLWLKDTAITNDGVKHLTGLSHLKMLSLLGTQVTDDGLVHLKDLSSLEQLFLGDTKITDDGLKHLECHKNLKLLRLRPC